MDFFGTSRKQAAEPASGGQGARTSGHSPIDAPLPNGLPAGVVATDPNARRRLGGILVERGLITPGRLADALERQRTLPGPRHRLGEVLISEGFLSEGEVATALAALLKLPLVDLAIEPPDRDVARLLPKLVAQQASIIPVGRLAGGGLRVAAADPTNVLALDDVRRITGVREVAVCVATASQVKMAISRTWTEAVVGSLDEVRVEATSVENHAADTEAALAAMGLGGGGVDDVPIVRMVNQLLAEAVRSRASDMHVEPGREALRVRYRIDGVLRESHSIPKQMARTLISRLKIVSGLDIAERRVPQDGRTRIFVDGKTVDCRVSTLPSVHGEKVVIRLLPAAVDVPPLDAIGMTDAQLTVINRVLHLPQGLILITGPTGSGKTNTLYAALRRIHEPERNIVTLEDPVEIEMPGITQVPVNVKTGLTFARGLRSILRQDPDVVLVGEVRDSETANLAMEAALTGHLVLTTLHTNDTVASLTRLIDMGVESYLVATSLALVVAQRLVRKPCDACSVPDAPRADVLERLGLTAEDIVGATPRVGGGCSQCSGTGFLGRMGVFELLEVTTPIRRVLLETPTEAALGHAAHEQGMVTLRASALEAARSGMTTFSEALRVTVRG